MKTLSTIIWLAIILSSVLNFCETHIPNPSNANVHVVLQKNVSNSNGYLKRAHQHIRNIFKLNEGNKKPLPVKIQLELVKKLENEKNYWKHHKKPFRPHVHKKCHSQHDRHIDRHHNRHHDRHHDRHREHDKNIDNEDNEWDLKEENNYDNSRHRSHQAYRSHRRRNDRHRHHDDCNCHRHHHDPDHHRGHNDRDHHRDHDDRGHHRHHKDGCHDRHRNHDKRDDNFHSNDSKLDINQWKLRRMDLWFKIGVAVSSIFIAAFFFVAFFVLYQRRRHLLSLGLRKGRRQGAFGKTKSLLIGDNIPNKIRGSGEENVTFSV